MSSQFSAERLLRALEAPVLAKNPLDNLEKQCVFCTFQRATNKLSIVTQLLPELQSEMSVEYNPLLLRMSELQRLTLPEDHPCGKAQVLDHLQQCCHFLQHVFDTTAQEILFQGTCHNLRFIVCCQNLKSYEEIAVKHDNIIIKDTILQLKDKIVEVGIDFKEVCDYILEQIHPCLKGAILNSWVQADNLLKHMKVRGTAKIENFSYMLKEKEHTLNKIYQKTYSDLEEEDKINNEIINYIEFVTSNLKEELQKWTERYNEEMETLDIALIQIKSKVDSQREKYQELWEIYNERKLKVDEIQVDTYDRERQMKLMLKQTRAALVIQSWWRGLLLKRMIKTIKLEKTQSKLTKMKKIRGKTVKKQ